MMRRAWLLAAALVALPATGHAELVHVIRVDGAINPGVSSFVTRAVQEAGAAGAAALVIELDTPGGQVPATQEIVESVLNAPLPVLVFVSPRGAFAASAGTFITLAGHVAAMAPGTSIGAAHPVFLSPFGTPPQPPLVPPGEEEGGGESQPPPVVRDIMSEKVENLLAAYIESIAEERERNVEWAVEAVRNSVAITHKEAVELRVVDLVAEDVPHLLELVDGREVRVGRQTVRLATAEAQIEQRDMTGLDRFYAMIADPSVAFLLLLGGLGGLYLEFSQPGLFVPGILGAICLILAGFAFQVVPFNWLGLILILIGIGLMATELFVASFGLLFTAGALSLGAGGYLLFDVPELSDLTVPFFGVILPTVAVFVVFGAIVVFGVTRSFGRPQYAGLEGMVGDLAVADSDLEPTGRVFIHGEYWKAEAAEPIRRGEQVRVVEVRDLLLRVARASNTVEESS